MRRQKVKFGSLVEGVSSYAANDQLSAIRLDESKIIEENHNPSILRADA
jgi:hypothetical protein